MQKRQNLIQELLRRTKSIKSSKFKIFPILEPLQREFVRKENIFAYFSSVRRNFSLRIINHQHKGTFSIQANIHHKQNGFSHSNKTTTTAKDSHFQTWLKWLAHLRRPTIIFCSKSKLSSSSTKLIELSYSAAKIWITFSKTITNGLWLIFNVSLVTKSKGILLWLNMAVW